jgi:hypothetical protein
MLIARDMAYALDPVAFAQAAGIACDPWQADLLTGMPKRGLLNCSRQSGKTTTCSLMATHVASYEPDSLVVIVSPSQRQSTEMLRSVRMLHQKVDGLPELVSESVLKIELANGSRVLALPGGEQGKTIRGLAGARLVIVDEAARVEDELLAAVRPMLATRSDGAFIMLSTPAGKRGAFYELWHDGDQKWTRVRVPASACPRISKEWLAEELKALGAARFSEEYELAFIDADSSAFPTSIIDRAFTTELLPLWV